MNKLLVWDIESTPPSGDWITVLWRDFTNREVSATVSIPQLVEAEPDALRSRYLEFLFDLGETYLKGRRLVDHLQIRQNFSYWWMTLFSEKCNYVKSPQIDNIIRFFAFEEWFRGKEIGCVTLVSANQQLMECFQSLCQQCGMKFEWQSGQPLQSTPVSLVRRAYSMLPTSIKALGWLLHYLVRRWPLKGVGLGQWWQTNGGITFVSYLFNLVPDAQKAGRYESRYWAHLPSELRKQGVATNWLHLYVADTLIPSAKDAALTIKNFNLNGQKHECHVTLDTFISVSVIIRTIRDWWRLQWIGVCLGDDLSKLPRLSFSLWPLLRDDWRESIFGVNAMWSLLSLNLFEAALKKLPRQNSAVYLQENQGWEFGFIGAWQRAGHRRLIGVPHSTLRFWDLRYYFDPRSYQRDGNNELPLPNLIACNGPVMRDGFLDGGYSSEGLVDVEALRYLHLGETKSKPKLDRFEKRSQIRLLVLGDYLSTNTHRQMELLRRAVPLLPSAPLIVVKPHPNCPIKAVDYPTLKMKVTMQPIGDLLSECDVAYSSAVTSAAVDAYCANVPVVSMLDPKTLNLSPLRGSSNARFASTPEELANAFVELSKARNDPTASKEFFMIDAQLPRWKALLK